MIFATSLSQLSEAFWTPENRRNFTSQFSCTLYSTEEGCGEEILYWRASFCRNQGPDPTDKKPCGKSISERIPVWAVLKWFLFILVLFGHEFDRIVAGILGRFLCLLNFHPADRLEKLGRNLTVGEKMEQVREGRADWQTDGGRERVQQRSTTSYQFQRSRSVSSA